MPNPCAVSRTGLTVEIGALVILHRQRVAEIIFQHKGKARRRDSAALEGLPKPQLDVRFRAAWILQGIGGQQRQPTAAA